MHAAVDWSVRAADADDDARPMPVHSTVVVGVHHNDGVVAIFFFSHPLSRIKSAHITARLLALPPCRYRECKVLHARLRA